MLKVIDITVEKLKNNELVDELPELYELRNIVENNIAHVNDPVFTHTLSVLDNLQELLKNTNEYVNSYLNKTADKHMKKQLLFLATMFHDIGKKETAVKNGNQTKFPGHEEYGSKKVKPILDRIDISDNEKNIVAEMIKYHGELHVIVTPNNKKLKEQYESFKHRHSTFFLELILLAMADDLGSQLKDNDPDEFNFAISFFNEIIDNYKSL